MTPTRQSWFQGIASRIPCLLDLIAKGNKAAFTIMGRRMIGGRIVELRLVAEVVDAGADPLRSHASVNYPSRDIQTLDNMAVPAPRHRKRSKRW